MNENELIEKIREKGISAPELSRIRVLAIDLDNTLLDFDLCAAKSIQQGFADWNLPFSERVLDTFLAINNDLWTKIEYGELSVEGLKQIRWKTIFEALGWRDLDGPAFEQIFRHYLYESHEPVEGAKEAIEALSPAYDLMIVSNGGGSQQKNRLALSGFSESFFDLLTSEEAGRKKPDPLFFETMFSRIQKRIPDIEKDQVLIIGDSLHADVYGAMQSGFPFLWFQRNPQERNGENLERAKLEALDWPAICSLLLEQETARWQVQTGAVKNN